MRHGLAAVALVGALVVLVALPGFLPGGGGEPMPAASARGTQTVYADTLDAVPRAAKHFISSASQRATPKPSAPGVESSPRAIVVVVAPRGSHLRLPPRTRVVAAGTRSAKRLLAGNTSPAAAPAPSEKSDVQKFQRREVDEDVASARRPSRGHRGDRPQEAPSSSARFARSGDRSDDSKNG